MTETEWLAGTDPRVLLDHVHRRATPRQLRLYACACVRQFWPLLRDPRSVAAVVTAERFAEGRAAREELLEAEKSAFEVARGADLRQTVSDPAWAAARAAARAANRDAYSAASGTAFIAALCAAPWQMGEGGVVLHHGDRELKGHARALQCRLLRDVAGNPFRAVFLLHEWLDRNDGAARALARVIHDEARYSELPVLGDALEEAGCDVPEVLDHCRGPGPHVRGCWVVDLVLGK